MQFSLATLAACLLSLGLPGLAVPVAGQEAPGESPAPAAIALEDFRLSGPPALSLLGAAASSVARPNTPRDLIASLVSGAGSNGIVPDGFALETAPFWLARHRALGLREYHDASLADRLRYFTAVSVATSRVRSAGDSVAEDARVALAVRTLLANGRPSRALLDAGDSIRAQQTRYIVAYRQWEAMQRRASGLAARQRRLVQQENLLSSLVTRVLVGQQAALRDSAMRTLARRDSLRTMVAAGEAAADSATELAASLDRVEARLATLAKRFAGEELEPDGFILEVAGGVRGLFEKAEWGRQQVDGFAAWVTPMYRIGERGLELVGVARYMSDVREYDGRDLIDLGARTGIDVGKGSIAAEHVWRRLTSPSGRRTTRWSLVFDYPLGGKLWAVASFGSDYRRPQGSRPVIATVGLNLGFGAIEVLPGPRR